MRRQFRQRLTRRDKPARAWLPLALFTAAAAGSAVANLVNVYLGFALSFYCLAVWLSALLVLFAHHRGRRVAIAADHGGLTEIIRFGRSRRHFWDEVRALRVTASEAWVQTLSGTLRFGPEVAGWRELIALTEHESGVRAALVAEPVLVDAEELAAWLHLEGDESLTVGAASGSRAFYDALVLFQPPLGALAGLLFWAWQFFSGRNIGPLLNTVLLGTAIWSGLGLLSAGALRQLHRRRHPLRVSASLGGLTVSGPFRRARFYAWSEIQGLDVSAGSPMLLLGDEPLLLEPASPETARLVAAIEQVLAAGHEGRRPARLTDLPTGALSLSAQAATVSVDRGLSRSVRGPLQRG